MLRRCFCLETRRRQGIEAIGFNCFLTPPKGWPTWSAPKNGTVTDDRMMGHKLFVNVVGTKQWLPTRKHIKNSHEHFLQDFCT